MAIEKLINGELLQLEKSRKINFQEKNYIEIIKGKTAALLAVACAAGATSTFKENKFIRRLHSFGETIGISFQIKDDLLDYTGLNIGKPVGNDIKEKKVTLTLIYTINNSPRIVQKKLLKLFKKKQPDEESINYIIDAVIRNGGIADAEEKMISYRNEALAILREFPATDTRNALTELVCYITERMH